MRRALHNLPGGPGRFSGHVAPPKAERKHQLTSARRQINRSQLAANQDAAQDTISHLSAYYCGDDLGMYSLCVTEGIRTEILKLFQQFVLATAAVIVPVLLLDVSLKFPPSPKCDTLICTACPSVLLISSSFLAPSILLLHQVPEPRADLSHLGSHGEVTAGQEVHRQPIGTPFSSRCQGERGRSCWQQWWEGADHSNYYSYLKRSDQPSVCVTERHFDQHTNQTGINLVQLHRREFITTLSQSIVYIKLD